MMFEKLILKPSEIEVFVRGEKVKDEQRYTHPMERKIKSRWAILISEKNSRLKSLQVESAQIYPYYIFLIDVSINRIL